MPQSARLDIPENEQNGHDLYTLHVSRTSYQVCSKCDMPIISREDLDANPCPA